MKGNLLINLVTLDFLAFVFAGVKKGSLSPNPYVKERDMMCRP
jgi:hypothetical protein